MGAAQFACFLGIESGVNSAKNYIRSALPRQFPNFVSPQGIRGMNADTDGVSRLNTFGIHRAECFIHQNGIAEALGSGACQYVLPTRSNDRSPERNVARVNQMDVHAQCSFLLWISPNSFTSH